MRTMLDNTQMDEANFHWELIVRRSIDPNVVESLDDGSAPPMASLSVIDAAEQLGRETYRWETVLRETGSLGL